MNAVAIKESHIIGIRQGGKILQVFLFIVVAAILTAAASENLWKRLAAFRGKPRQIAVVIVGIVAFGQIAIVRTEHLPTDKV